MSTEQDRKLLKRRALELAIPLENRASETDAVNHFLFSLQSEAYGMEAKFVSEVFSMAHFTSVPGTPRFIMGVTSVHGEIVSLMDLGHFFGQPRLALTNLNTVVLVHKDRLKFGIVIDEPLGIASISTAALKEPPPSLGAGRAPYVSGLASGNLIILNMDSFWASENLLVNIRANAFANRGERP